MISMSISWTGWRGPGWIDQAGRNCAQAAFPACAPARKMMSTPPGWRPARRGPGVQRDRGTEYIPVGTAGVQCDRAGDAPRQCAGAEQPASGARQAQ